MVRLRWFGGRLPPPCRFQGITVNASPHPLLKVAIGSATTSAVILIGGVVLMVLPTMVVRNELLILGGVALAVGRWFLAHRHGQFRGMVDANKNGADDRVKVTTGKVSH